MNYLNRIADELLSRKLRSSAAVLVEGPKWCGKTSTCAQLAKSVIYIQDPDKRNSYRKMADTQPSLLLQGETPRLIDEWQTIPVLWDAVRFAADQRQKIKSIFYEFHAFRFLLPRINRITYTTSNTTPTAMHRIHTRASALNQGRSTVAV